MTVKVMILNKDGEVEREYIHEDFEKENSLFDVEEDMEGAVEQALDVLAECAPAAFASEKDGKIYGYRFEIVDPNYDPDYVD